MEQDQAITWLKQAGSPAIQWWIANQQGDAGKTKPGEDAFDRVQQSDIARRWLDLICITDLHGSKPSCFENVIPGQHAVGNACPRPGC